MRRGKGREGREGQRRDGRVGFASDLFWYTWSAHRVASAANIIRASRRRRRSLRLSEIINATLDKLIFISDILANYEMQLFSRPVAAFNVAPRRCRCSDDDDDDDDDGGGGGGDGSDYDARYREPSIVKREMNRSPWISISFYIWRIVVRWKLLTKFA